VYSGFTASVGGNSIPAPTVSSLFVKGRTQMIVPLVRDTPHEAGAFF
jgi:hypothetical protein